MLRRTVKPPQPGPVDLAPRRRRRVIIAVAGGFVVGLLLLVAWFMAVWLREYPAVNPRWVKAPDAVALVQLEWARGGEALVRPALAELHRRRLGNTVDFDTFWSSLRFMLHSPVTLWILPGGEGARQATTAGAAGETGAGARSSSARTGAATDDDLRWLAAGSLRRRRGMIENKINQLLGRLGARGAGEAKGSRLAGGVRLGGLALGNAPGRVAQALESLAAGSDLVEGGAAAPPASDDLWSALPAGAPLAFVIRRPARWAAPVIRFMVGEKAGERLDALWPASPALFADAPWLTGAGSVSTPDTLTLTLGWDLAAEGDARRLQDSAVNKLIANINRALRDGPGARVEAAPAPRPGQGQTGLILTFTGWTGPAAP